MKNLYKTLPSGLSDQETIQWLAEWVRDATRNRRFDLEDYDNQESTRPKIYDAPSSLTTLIGTEKVGDLAVDDNYLYVVVDNAGTLEWKTITYNGGDAEFSSVNTGNGAVELYPSGTYTPTLTETSGITSSSVGTCYYYRVGDMVHVFGSVTIEPSGVSADTILDVSLPIASDLTAGGQLSGAFRVANAGDQPSGVIFGNPGDVARFRITAGNTASRQFSFLFSYVVL